MANVDVTVIELEKGEEGSEVEWGRESEGRGKAERWGEGVDPQPPTPPHPFQDPPKKQYRVFGKTIFPIVQHPASNLKKKNVFANCFSKTIFRVQFLRS